MVPIIFIGDNLSISTRQWLKQKRIKFIEQPFICTEYKLPDLQCFNRISNKSKQWVVVSVYAAQWLSKYGEQIGITAGDCLYCWSEKQASMLRSLNLPIIVSPYNCMTELCANIVNQNRGDSVVFLHGGSSSNEMASLFAQHSIPYFEAEVFSNAPVKKDVNGIFDAYLFFSATSIDNFKASGNFPNPKSLIYTNDISVARAAWRLFTNKVCLLPELDELPLVEYSIERWKKEKEQRDKRKCIMV